MPPLSVIVPCYNERATIAEIIRRVQASAPEAEIIVVDDGSTDGSREILAQLTPESHPMVRVLLHETNKGKGAALHTGFDAAGGEILLIQDADLEYDPRDYPALLRPIQEGRADVVYGSRFLGGPRKAMMFWGRERLAEINYEIAVEKANKGDRGGALWHLDAALNLSPKMLEAIKMKQELTGREVTTIDGSTIRSFVTRAILNDRAPATQPSVDAAPATQPFADGEDVITIDVAIAPTTQPAKVEEFAQAFDQRAGSLDSTLMESLARINETVASGREAIDGILTTSIDRLGNTLTDQSFALATTLGTSQEVFESAVAGHADAINKAITGAHERVSSTLAEKSARCP